MRVDDSSENKVVIDWMRCVLVLLWIFISIVHKNVISIHSLLKNEPRNGIIHPIYLEKKADHYGNVLQEALETADRP